MLRTLIIGYGNPLRSDDSFGWQVANQLADIIADDEVEVIACHQLTPELAEPISHADIVIFIDAAVDAPAGQVNIDQLQFEPADVPTSFSHGFDAGDLLHSAATLYGHAPTAHLISVGGESFEMGEELSATMQAALPQVLDMVQHLLAGSAARLIGE